MHEIKLIICDSGLGVKIRTVHVIELYLHRLFVVVPIYLNCLENLNIEYLNFCVSTFLHKQSKYTCTCTY